MSAVDDEDEIVICCVARMPSGQISRSGTLNSGSHATGEPARRGRPSRVYILKEIGKCPIEERQAFLDELRELLNTLALVAPQAAECSRLVRCRGALVPLHLAVLRLL